MARISADVYSSVSIYICNSVGKMHSHKRDIFYQPSKKERFQASKYSAVPGNFRAEMQLMTHDCIILRRHFNLGFFYQCLICNYIFDGNLSLYARNHPFPPHHVCTVKRTPQLRGY
jgi:hypothetical protein